MNTTLKMARILPNQLKIIDQNDINTTVALARHSPTYRSPILLNKSFSEKPQRFVNCLTSTTYVRPHNHVDTGHWELMSWIAGVVYVIFFDEEGKVTGKIKMSADDVKIIEIPPDLYHTFITPDYAAYLEIRNCTYEPNFDRVYPAWAPPEKSPTLPLYIKKLYHAVENQPLIIS